MAQDFQKLVSGVTRFDQLYGVLNAWLDVLLSNFSGPQFPANPTTGQPCFRTDMTPPRLYRFDGSAWVDPGATSPAVVAAVTELVAARGSAASLEARLDVTLNDDGTLKAPAPAAGWWAAEPDTVERMSDNQFTVSGDKTHIYTKRRAVRLEQNADAQAWVLSSSYQASAGVTVVSLTSAVVDAGLSGVRYGQEVGNEPNVKGLQPFEIEVKSTNGVRAVSLADFGISSIAGDWYPVLQILGARPYLAQARDITQAGFTLCLFRPDGSPGADVSAGIAECGSGLACGAGQECGQHVPVRGVRVGVLLPV